MGEYGRDLSGVEDLNFALSEVAENSRLGVGQSVARRLMTSRLFYDDEYGFDVRTKLGSAQQNPGAFEARIEDEVLKDERVRSADVSVVYIGETVQIDIQVVTDDLGEFEFTLEVDALSVELLAS